MLETIRKHHYILMLFIAILVCVAFVFFNDAGTGRAGNPDAHPIATVDGHPYYRTELSQIDSQRAMVFSLLDPKNQMAMFSDPLAFYVNTLGGNPRFGRPAIVQRYGMTRNDTLNMDFCMNVATIRAEAKKLGIEVDREDLQKFVQTISGFQTNGQFDSSLYEAYLNNGAFGDRAGTERRLYTTLRDIVLFQRLNKLIGGIYTPSQAEVDAAYARNKQKITAAYALVEKAKQTPPAPADEAISKFYDEAKAKFDAHAADPTAAPADPLILSEEKRTLRYVTITLPEPPAPLTAPQPEDTTGLPEDQKKAKEEAYKKKLEEHTAAMAARSEAMTAFENSRKELLAKAAALSSDLTAEDRAGATFEDLVKKAGLEAKTTEPFTQAAPPAEFKDEPRVLAEIFQSSSDPTQAHTVQSAKGYVLFEVAKTEVPAVLPLDQVKAKISDKLKAEAVDAAVKTAAETARTAIVEAIKGGKTFTEAATAAGLTPVEVPAFSREKPPVNVPNQAIITEAATELNVGEVSTPKAVPEGLILISTLKRELPKDPKMDEDKKQLATQMTEGTEGGFMPTYSPLFEAWFNAHRNETTATTPQAAN